MIGSSAAGASDYFFGTDYQQNYQGYSQLYENIAANPGSGPTAGGVLVGTANTELNIVTLGGAGVVEGGYNAYQTGNYNQLQDSFAGVAVAGLASYGLNGMNPVTFRGQSATLNPENAFTEGIQPNGDNMDLSSHAVGDPDGYGSSPDSGYVGTSQSFDVASDTYAGWAYGGDGPVYEIQSGRGVNVNDNLGDLSPNPGDQEVAMPGGIYGSEVNGYYTSAGNFVANPYAGLNGTYAGLTGLGSELGTQTAYLSGPTGTKR
jgi:hypothetical protein